MTASLTTITIILSLFLLVWTILFILLPFFVFKIRNQIVETNRKLDRLLLLASDATSALENVTFETKKTTRQMPAAKIKSDNGGVLCSHCGTPFFPDSGTDPDQPICLDCMITDAGDSIRKTKRMDGMIACIGCMKHFTPDSGTDPDKPLCLNCMLSLNLKKANKIKPL